MILLRLILLMAVRSCGLQSFFKKSELQEKRHTSLHNNDYRDQLIYLKNVYLKSDGIETIELKRRSKKFLERLHQKIAVNNSNILDSSIQPKFHVIKDEIPFIFSVPDGNYFFSDSLIKKYIKNEDVLIAALTFQIFKSHRNIFTKKLYPPKGFITTRKFLELVEVSKMTKVKINEWCFNLLKRANYDPFVFLIWLQLQNKNSLDFSLMNGIKDNISMEEFEYKKLLTQADKYLNYDGVWNKNSTRDFYYFLRNISGD